MSGALSPWLLLLAGFLAGWIIEWLLDVFFFRPREATDLQRHVACLQDDRQQQEAELQRMRATVADLQAELDAARRARIAPVAAAPAEHLSEAADEDLAAPAERRETPPDADAAAAELQPAAPQVEAGVPEAEPAAPEPAARVIETVVTKE